MRFESLLRGISVTTYGQPFYAGSGLTNDLEPRITRRKPGLTLHEFLYGCLILYPRYFDPVTRKACPVEVVVDRLLDATAHSPSQANRVAAKLQGWIAKPNPFWR
jgi:capsular polysaccharide export protein